MAFRWGIIGTGAIAEIFAQDLVGTSHEIYAVGSRSLSKAKSFGYGKVFYGSYEELVHDPEIDAVYVATPHSYHHHNTLLALHAGKPVLVEKAFTISAGQAHELIDLAEKKHLALMEAMWTRFLPHIKIIREVISSGDIGEVLYVEASHFQNLPRTRVERLWNPELGGGALLDLGVYPVSFAQMILGKPTQIEASAQLTDENVDATNMIRCSYPNGASAQLASSMLAQGPNRALIVGREGFIELGTKFYAPTDIRITQGKSERFIENSYPSHGLKEEALEFEKIVREGKTESELMSHRDTLDVMEMMDEVRRQCGIRYPNI